MAKKKQGKSKESAEPDTSISPELIPDKMDLHPPKTVIENYSKVYEYPDILDFVQNYPKNKYLLIKDSKGDFREIVDGVFQKLLNENKIPKLSPIYFEDCASRNEANHLLHEFQEHKNKESKAFFFHNVAGSTYRNGGNIDLLNDLRDRVSSGRLPLVIIGLREDVNDLDLPKRFPSFFKVVDLSRPLGVQEEEKIIVEKQEEDINQPKPEETIKLKLIENGSMVFWEGKPLTTIRGKDFDILLKLARNPMKIVTHAVLYKFIDSSGHEDELLRQRINYIRNAFPSPFSDYKHPQAIIKTKRMEGYYLNLAEKQVEIVE